MRLVDPFGAELIVRAQGPAGWNADVFNVEVHEYHTYHVGAFAVWVHNAPCCKSSQAFKDAISPAAEDYYELNRAIGQTVLFGQRRISSTFANLGSNAPDFIVGRSIYAVAEDLRMGRLTSDDVLIHAFRIDDSLVTFNNRGLAALSLGHLTPTMIVERLPTVSELKRLTESPLGGLKIPGRSTAVTPGPKNLTIEDIVTIPGW
ncbi:hypothetical protein [Roseateles terrae]|uniref:Intein C-terminal splicing domain-containing protein n=1 Tax=Roseateles terrae TaxID=431060 RepID=A0ABR6H0D5_9BURK|nr:hypothetical protein [Roseateles terrae]MBB3197189.1 hypothetical protein [Roseateles terrae]